MDMPSLMIPNDRARTAALAAEIVALRVIVTRIALGLAENQDEMSSERWMHTVAEECAEIVKHIPVSAEIGFDVDDFRHQTIHKIFEFLTGEPAAMRMNS